MRMPQTGAGAAPALEILASLPRKEGNPFIICGGKPGCHLVNYKDPWTRIKTAAGLDDVRPHDLRHSFASIAVSGGMSLPLIGALLGHTQTHTTARYAHLASDPLKSVADLVGAKIQALMAGEQGGAVIELQHEH
jgi:integrase